MRVVVCGGSVIGLASAMLLAGDGHEVTVLEQDEQAPCAPRAAWDGWERKGVPQFRQPHNLFPRFQRIIDAELPEITERLVDAGCAWQNDPFRVPAFLQDQQPRPGDDRFRYLTGRRPVVEACFGEAAQETRGITVRRGVRVLDHLYDGTRVTGVRTDHGDVPADLVVDAMGRRSPTVDLLRSRGLEPSVESQDRGFTYYTRYFQGPELPAQTGPVLQELGSISALTLYGDNSTWSVTLFITSDDKQLKALRHCDVFDRVVAALPAQAHWLRGEPLTEVLPMAGVLDKHRRFVVDDRPLVTGLLAVGDAWACTNPSSGRGLSVGMVHAQQLRRVVSAHGDDLAALAWAWDAATEEHVSPFYWEQVSEDTERVAEMQAIRDGREPAPKSDPVFALGEAAGEDADCFRAILDVVYCLAHVKDVLLRPDVAAKVAQVGPSVPAAPGGPSRKELLELVG